MLYVLGTQCHQSPQNKPRSCFEALGSEGRLHTRGLREVRTRSGSQVQVALRSLPEATAGQSPRVKHQTGERTGRAAMAARGGASSRRESKGGEEGSRGALGWAPGDGRAAWRVSS